DSDINEITNITEIPIVPKPTSKVFTTLDKKKLEETTLPTKFICPISKQLMINPVRISGSKVPVAYEKLAIEAHYEEYGTDPMTNNYIEDDADFTPDLALKRQINDFCITNNIFINQIENEKSQKKRNG
ncbi:hypothetical protein N9L02_03655, partial [Gammaproteobacteria bacterium]|nr:hypothetical protein [Gammaproteobacteria bacterium]